MLAHIAGGRGAYALRVAEDAFMRFGMTMGSVLAAALPGAVALHTSIREEWPVC